MKKTGIFGGQGMAFAAVEEQEARFILKTPKTLLFVFDKTSAETFSAHAINRVAHAKFSFAHAIHRVAHAKFSLAHATHRLADANFSLAHATHRLADANFSLAHATHRLVDAKFSLAYATHRIAYANFFLAENISINDNHKYSSEMKKGPKKINSK